jgi:DNA-binding GntR family transcriptional regulator
MEVALNRMALGDEIANRLRDRILKGQLQAGQRLTEQSTAKEMGTSPGPVREAFSALAREGLVISLRHRGTFVSAVSEQEAKTAYDLRAWIEPHVMELALHKLPSPLTQELEQKLVEMRAAAKRKDFPAVMRADLEFHGRIYELAGGQMLAKVWQVIQLTILKFAVVAAPHYYRDRDLNASIADHQLLLDLLQNGEAGALRKNTIRHLTDLWVRMQAAANDHHRSSSKQ